MDYNPDDATPRRHFAPAERSAPIKFNPLKHLSVEELRRRERDCNRDGFLAAANALSILISKGNWKGIQ